MRKNKTWTVDLFDRSSVLGSSNVEQGQNDEFWTNDTEAYLNFKPNNDSFEFTEAELTMYNKNDGSLVVLDSTDGVEVEENVVSYEMQPEVIAHFGKWTVQVRFIRADNESFTSGIIEYEVKRALGDAIPERLTAMKSWDTFFAHAQETIDLISEAELARQQAELDRQAQEEAREQAELDRLNKDLLRDDKIAQMEADKDAVIANATVDSEVILARGGKDTLGQRLDETTAQLAQKANESATFANARNRLKIINYLGNIDNIHPKVLYFEEGWNEWKFWMAYTPYPGGYTENENPSIAVSRDGINWTTPDGLVNPVEPKPDNGYNSDTHLVMNNGTMELWWRSAFAGDTFIYRRTSNDGVNWSNREEVLNSVSYGGDILSPAIIVENGRYKMWGCRSGQVVYNESNDGSSWNKENEVTLNINWGNLTAWHLDVIHTDKGYELLVQAYHPGGGNNFSNLYYVESQDNTSFSEPIMVMKPSTGGSWDNQGIYRSSVVKVSGVYHVYYSAISSNNRRAISLSVGEELSALKGYENSGTFDMSAYSVDDERGLRLSKPVVLPSGFQERGAYIQTSSLPSTAKIAGASRGREYVGGLEVSNLYIVDKEESASLPLDIVRGTVRRDEMKLEMYDGDAWKDINDSRENLVIIGAQDINGMDLRGVRSIIFTGTGTVTITGFSGGSRYQETDLYIDSSTITVIIKEGSGVVNPDREDFVLNQSKVNCRVMRVASSRWRIYE